MSSRITDDSGVSPVIASVLMVAITVVVAASIFILTQQLADREEEPVPIMLWDRSESEDRLTLRRAGEGNWNDFTIQADVAGLRFALGAESTPASTELATSGTALPNTPLVAGEYLDFCGASGPVLEVTILLSHGETNTVVRLDTFSSVDPC